MSVNRSDIEDLMPVTDTHQPELNLTRLKNKSRMIQMKLSYRWGPGWYDVFEYLQEINTSIIIKLMSLMDERIQKVRDGAPPELSKKNLEAIDQLLGEISVIVNTGEEKDLFKIVTKTKDMYSSPHIKKDFLKKLEKVEKILKSKRRK